MWRDLKYAMRLLAKTPSFTALMVVVMALGLGLSIYMFSFVNMLAYKTLDIERGEQVVAIDSIRNGQIRSFSSINGHDYQYLKQKQQSFEVFEPHALYVDSLSNGISARCYRGEALTSGALSILKGKIILGRSLMPGDDISGSDPVVVISEQVWGDDFNSDPNIIGRTVRLDGVPTQVVGVMDRAFRLPNMDFFWKPLHLAKNPQAGSGDMVTILARLKPGITAEQANAELNQYASELSVKYPQSNKGMSIAVRSLPKKGMDNSMVIVYMLTTASLFILLLVIANVGNLMLTRASERNKEVAIRTALGAPRWRIIRQMLFETLIICIIGGLFGILIAGIGLDLTKPVMLAMRGGSIPPWWTFNIGSEELSGALCIIVATALLTGLLPALKASNNDFNTVLRDGSRGGQGKKAGRLSRLLVIFEVVLSCALLLLAVLVILNIRQTVKTDYGIKPQQYLTAALFVSEQDYPDVQSNINYFSQLMALLKQQPGVNAVSFGQSFPGGGGGEMPFIIEGSEVVIDNAPQATTLSIGNNYLDTLQVPILQGRGFNDSDSIKSDPVVIVSAATAEYYWPGESALGKRIQLNPGPDNARWLTIVGISKDILFHYSDNRGFKAVIYRPYTQGHRRFMHVILRSEGDPELLRAPLSEVMGKLDPDLAADNINTISTSIKRDLMGMLFIGDLFIIFGGFALVLAAAGIYGVMSRSIYQRTHEIGVRRALGADEERIIKMVLLSGGKLLITGVIIGTVLAYLGGSIAAQMFVGLLDPFVLSAIVVVLLITLVFTFATLLPTLRSVKLEPTSALRYE